MKKWKKCYFASNNDLFALSEKVKEPTLCSMTILFILAVVFITVQGVSAEVFVELKEYRKGNNQLGIIDDYQQFVDELERVWRECYRILVSGGRIVCVVGDVCLSRRKYGRHVVMPLHSDIVVSCRKIGFDNLNPILWHKISNASYEANTNSSILGKPYEPNAINTNRNSIDVETEEYYCKSTMRRLDDNRNLFSMHKVSYVDLSREKDYETLSTTIKFHQVIYELELED